MPQQVTFDSYATAVAGGADTAWSPDQRATSLERVREPYGVDAPATADSEPERYVTFGVVEFAPRE